MSPTPGMACGVVRVFWTLEQDACRGGQLRGARGSASGYAGGVATV